MPDIDYGQILEALNNKVDLSGSWSAPTSQYDDLTLGTSGTTYTAPADGYAFFGKESGTTTAYILLFNVNTKMGIECRSNGNTNNLRVYLPVKKGDVFGANYSATGNTTFFRFIYAQKTN